MSAFSAAIPMRPEGFDEFLMSDEAGDGGKLLSGLDGFLTAVAIGPELILPSEWLPRVLGEEPQELPSLEQVEVVIGTLLGRYNQIIGQLRDDPGSYRPVFWEDERGRMIVDDWVAGFMDGVAMRAQGC